MQNINSDFFEIKHNGVEPQKGKILISMPFLHDSFFKRSTILLIEHNREGSIGFILNKPLQFKLQDLIDIKTDTDFTIAYGGPVAQDTLHFIHSVKEIPNSSFIKDGLFWGGNIETVKFLIEKGSINNYQIRFFLGYAGWSPLQLKNEIKENSWLVGDLSVYDILTQNSNQNWKQSLQSLGERYKLWANFPDNPNYN